MARGRRTHGGEESGSEEPDALLSGASQAWGDSSFVADKAIEQAEGDRRTRDSWDIVHRYFRPAVHESYAESYMVQSRPPPTGMFVAEQPREVGPVTVLGSLSNRPERICSEPTFKRFTASRTLDGMSS